MTTSSYLVEALLHVLALHAPFLGYAAQLALAKQAKGRLRWATGLEYGRRIYALSRHRLSGYFLTDGGHLAFLRPVARRDLKAKGRMLVALPGERPPVVEVAVSQAPRGMFPLSILRDDEAEALSPWGVRKLEERRHGR